MHLHWGGGRGGEGAKGRGGEGSSGSVRNFLVKFNSPGRGEGALMEGGAIHLPVVPLDPHTQGGRGGQTH